MAQKKATEVKKRVAAKGKRVAKGDSYVCGVCGLSVIVDEECGCTVVHELLCCGEPMKAK